MYDERLRMGFSLGLGDVNKFFKWIESRWNIVTSHDIDWFHSPGHELNSQTVVKP